jgi:outer membrane protein OmpA-like peptidoglycan-associated protein
MSRPLSRLAALCLLFLAHNAAAQDFRVQIAAFGERMKPAYFKERGVENYIESTDQLGLYRYFAGSYASREAAEKVQHELMEKGFPFATIIDIEEQRILCGAGCPYFRNGVLYVQDPQQANTVRNIYFDFGRYSLTEESRQLLREVAEQMKSDASLKLKVLGYTDGVGSPQANMQLAGNRARSARNYLIGTGIRADRMFIKVYGEADPAAPNTEETTTGHPGEDLPDNRKWNRRVVLALVDDLGEVKTSQSLNK